MDDKALLNAIREIVRDEVQAETSPINVRLDALEAGQAAMQSDMTAMQSDMKTVQADMKTINTRLDNLEEGQETIRNSQLQTELVQYPRIQASIDGVLAGIETRKAQNKRFDALETTTARHDVEIAALKHAVKIG